jgi:hypothetical protein
MRNFFKITAFLFLIVMFFLSCTSEEEIENIVSEEQKITTELTQKIITTATSLNDYNFFVSNATKSSCDILSITSGYFNNPEGSYSSFVFNDTESLDMWLTQYNDAKLQAFNSTGIEFSDEDFFISYIGNPSGIFSLEKRESMLNYFENCEFNFGNTTDYGLPFSDVSSNCNNNDNALINIFLYNEDGTSIYSFNSLDSVVDSLASYNFQNNTNYGLENVLVSSILYFNGTSEVNLLKTEDLLNYFENCMFSRDATDDDCLNFVYPITVNRFSLQLEEVITTAIENDEDLASAFGTDVGELNIIFPINLLGANGTVLTIENNEALEDALDNSSTYCN